MPLYRQTIVPTVQDPLLREREHYPAGPTGKTEDDPFFRFARKVMPIGDMKVTMHEPVLHLGGSDQGIRMAALDPGDKDVIWELEGREGYYYGASPLPRGTVWGGLGYLNIPVSVGVNRTQTYTHEIGHNMSLRHVACGKARPSGPDPNYPAQPQQHRHLRLRRGRRRGGPPRISTAT